MEVPLHGAGDVNHVEHFHGDTLGWLHSGRKGREEKIGFARGRIGGKEKSGLGLKAFGLLDFEDKVLVGNGGA